MDFPDSTTGGACRRAVWWTSCDLLGGNRQLIVGKVAQVRPSDRAVPVTRLISISIRSAASRTKCFLRDRNPDRWLFWRDRRLVRSRSDDRSRAVADLSYTFVLLGGVFEVGCDRVAQVCQTYRCWASNLTRRCRNTFITLTPVSSPSK